ncbi:lipocalin-like domain-containing protein [Pseudoruegeria sp. SK021]|uniref:lipocalin-like domain-containing protein n=1 Tax=Pseudoruegeria sp. SK021 TaxID=1933035 RepID=UPI000A228A6B|nr:lipocalin-like domain-containing protein [Pseudoruegeria sp. SK021]OSP54524.1 iron ABC transporter permease [Pseudoruegeria sp. SK021]
MSVRSLLCAGLIALQPSLGLAQGFAGLASDAEGFALPQPNPSFSFPRDHGPHPAFRIEWWYVTANLSDTAGRDYGVQWTLFRSALHPGETAGWDSPQIWFAHAAVTSAQRHLVGQSYARGGIGQAGVTATPFAAFINDWAMTGRAGPGQDGLSALDLTARGPDFAYDLQLDADGPLIRHGDGGYSVKSPRGQASYYYAQPGYQVSGHLDLPSGPVAVTGQAWLDREWSSQPLAPSQTGWDWFSLHLDSGDKLMVYRLRDTDGADFNPGTWIGQDGTAHYLNDGEITLTAQETTSIATATLPTTWRITVPHRQIDVIVTALNPQAWMDTTPAYWEGPVQVTDAASGGAVGRGYLEMTGYD